MNPHLDFLLSVPYDRDPLAPEHLADLRKSGLTDATIAMQKIRSVPPHMIDQLLGFPTPKVISAYIIPFANPCGGWMDHVRLKIFPPLKTERGTIKYLQPKRSGVRLYFPLPTLDAVLHSDVQLWVCEGEKKSLALSQIGPGAIGICGVESWHAGGSRELLSDFDCVPLSGRVVQLVPDGDVQTNLAVARAMHRLGETLERRGAHVQLVMLPVEVAA
jgi:hypothetical protein